MIHRQQCHAPRHCAWCASEKFRWQDSSLASLKTTNAGWVVLQNLNSGSLAFFELFTRNIDAVFNTVCDTENKKEPPLEDEYRHSID